jgi:hypothetical protein
MSTNQVERFHTERPAPAVERLGQATAVEQSRAMAEVQASVFVAQQNRRDTQAALQEMRDSCRNMRLAEKAFFRFSRGGAQVSGPTVHLARELARLWGNIQYGINELSRDDVHGQSEMQAWAWDVQTNTRSSQVFIVPHKRDKRGGPERLTDMRDIYEMNTNQAARRLRQAIWSVLPPWLVEEAEEICTKTLTDGGGVPLPKRISQALDYFGGKGVSRDRLETRIGRPSSEWTAHDVAQLQVISKSLERGEITIDEEFPQERVTAADLTSGRVTAADLTAQAEPPAEPPAEPDGWPDVAEPGGKK